MRKIIFLIAIVGLVATSFPTRMHAQDYITCHCSRACGDQSNGLKTLYITAVGDGNDDSGNERFCREKCKGYPSSWSVKYEANVEPRQANGKIVGYGCEKRP